jgi:transcription elongation factor Elf1
MEKKNKYKIQKCPKCDYQKFSFVKLEGKKALLKCKYCQYEWWAE